MLDERVCQRVSGSQPVERRLAVWRQALRREPLLDDGGLERTGVVELDARREQLAAQPRVRNGGLELVHERLPLTAIGEAAQPGALEIRCHGLRRVSREKLARLLVRARGGREVVERARNARALEVRVQGIGTQGGRVHLRRKRCSRLDRGIRQQEELALGQIGVVVGASRAGEQRENDGGQAQGDAMAAASNHRASIIEAVRAGHGPKQRKGGRFRLSPGTASGAGGRNPQPLCRILGRAKRVNRPKDVT